MQVPKNGYEGDRLHLDVTGRSQTLQKLELERQKSSLAHSQSDFWSWGANWYQACCCFFFVYVGMAICTNGIFHVRSIFKTASRQFKITDASGPFQEMQFTK